MSRARVGARAPGVSVRPVARTPLLACARTHMCHKRTDTSARAITSGCQTFWAPWHLAQASVGRDWGITECLPKRPVCSIKPQPRAGQCHVQACACTQSSGDPCRTYLAMVRVVSNAATRGAPVHCIRACAGGCMVSGIHDQRGLDCLRQLYVTAKERIRGKREREMLREPGRGRDGEGGRWRERGRKGVVERGVMVGAERRFSAPWQKWRQYLGCIPAEFHALHRSRTPRLPPRRPLRLSISGQRTAVRVGYTCLGFVCLCCHVPGSTCCPCLPSALSILPNTTSSCTRDWGSRQAKVNREGRSLCARPHAHTYK